MVGKLSARDEINQALYIIRNNIGKVDCKILYEQLNQLEKYKPLTLLYFNTYAKVLMSEGRYSEAIDKIASSIFWQYKDEYSAESAELIAECHDKLGNEAGAVRHNILAEHIEDKKERKVYSGFKNALDQWYKAFLNSGGSVADINEGYRLNFCLSRDFEAFLIALYQKIIFHTDDKLVNNIFRWAQGAEPNLGFLYKQLVNEENSCFILVADNENSINTYYALAKIIKLLGKEVIICDKMISVESDEEINIEDTVDISLSNIEKHNDFDLVHPIEVLLGEGKKQCNLSYILKALAEHSKTGLAYVISSRELLDELDNDPGISEKYQLLSSYRGDFDSYIGWACIGSYEAYIKQLYEYDYAKGLKEASQYKFSIVIPVRNASGTLRYTLKTCLEQRSVKEDEYEVIISDNSDYGNEEIHNLVKEINDPRIKYYRTPYVLPLNRNFEYAVGRAKGDFIIPIGADDGMLPWALEVLNDVLNKYPSENIIKWDRGLFNWSQSNNTDAGRFIIPSFYHKGEYQPIYVNAIEQLFVLLNGNMDGLYGLPLLYINSGFKRQYILKMLESMSSVYNGTTQDIYMGIVNLILNKQYLYIQYPITIAGMSDQSLGAQSKLKQATEKELKQYENNINKVLGYGVTAYGQYDFKPCEFDMCLFYSEVFRIYKKTKNWLVLNEIFKAIDWKKILTLMTERYSTSAIHYVRVLTVLRHNAYILSDEIGQWYTETIYNQKINKVWAITPVESEKYFVGFRDGLHLDARVFNVNDIYEAINLFRNITNL